MPSVRMRLTGSVVEQKARVKLFGVGSAGCSMIDGAKFPSVAVSSSAADLARCRSDRRVLIGSDRLVGISGSEPEMVRKIPSLVGHELLDVFNNTEVAFIMCGLGGSTGSLGARVLSTVARAKGSLAIVLAATPFSAESFRRRQVARDAVHDLSALSNLCIEFCNDKLSELAPNLPLSRAFAIQNAIMLRPVMDICATLARSDMPAFREVLSHSSYGRFGLGLARGDDRIERAVQDALTSPWFDFDLKEAEAAVVVYSAADPWEKEEEALVSSVAQRLPAARLAYGSYPDPTLGERIRATVVISLRAPTPEAPASE